MMVLLRLFEEGHFPVFLKGLYARRLVELALGMFQTKSGASSGLWHVELGLNEVCICI